MVEVTGPDVQTSCGAYGRVLQIGTVYVVGIGSVCGPISDWMMLSQYTPANIQLLRRLRDGDVECAGTTVECAGTTAVATSLILLMALLTVMTVI